MTILYVDVSHHDWNRHDGNLDWPAVLRATSKCVCIRATYGDPEGLNFETRHFRAMAKAAKNAGAVLVGAYHNLVSGDRASQARQVDFLRREMDKVDANWAMLDIERYPELLERDRFPRFGDVLRFQERWAKVDDRVLAHYFPKWVWSRSDMGEPDLRELNGPMVASNYGSMPEGNPASVYRKRGGDGGPGWKAYGRKRVSVWQYGSQINVPGASGDTDCNAFIGSFDDLTRLLVPRLATTARRPAPLEDDMEQTERLREKTGLPSRTVGNVLADSQNLRNWHVLTVGNPEATVNPPQAGSPDQIVLDAARLVLSALPKIADASNLDAADLQAIHQAAAQGAQAAVDAALSQFADAVLSRLADNGAVRPDLDPIRAAFDAELAQRSDGAADEEDAPVTG